MLRHLIAQTPTLDQRQVMNAQQEWVTQRATTSSTNAQGFAYPMHNPYAQIPLYVSGEFVQQTPTMSANAQAYSSGIAGVQGAPQYQRDNEWASREQAALGPQHSTPIATPKRPPRVVLAAKPSQKEVPPPIKLKEGLVVLSDEDDDDDNRPLKRNRKRAEDDNDGQPSQHDRRRNEVRRTSERSEEKVEHREGGSTRNRKREYSRGENTDARDPKRRKDDDSKSESSKPTEESKKVQELQDQMKRLAEQMQEMTSGRVNKPSEEKQSKKPQDVTSQARSRQAKMPCMHWGNGDCRNGDACPYKHDPAEKGKRKMPCKFKRDTGKCIKMDCMYDHDFK